MAKQSFTGIPELVKAYRQLGPLKFILMIGGTLAYIGFGVWLMIETSFPEAYGSTCHGRGCFISDLWYSPRLLHHGFKPMLLFVWLWAMPALVVGAIGWALWRNRSRKLKLSLFANEPADDMGFPVKPKDDLRG